MKAIILFSGGLDSTVMLALALKTGRECIAISFDYGQRHRVELEHAAQIAQYYQVQHRIIKIDLSVFSSSSLLSDVSVPKNRSFTEINSGGIPSTYVPARNLLFLAYAMGQAELYGAQEIYMGPNAMDARPYPDCRPVFLEAFQQVMNVATKQAVEGAPPRLVTPLLHWDKEEIVRQGRVLGVPLNKTFSCYSPTPLGEPCQVCDACTLRKSAFDRLEI
jgi:7-cyano-7-deazaguanine synthase